MTDAAHRLGPPRPGKPLVAASLAAYQALAMTQHERVQQLLEGLFVRWSFVGCELRFAALWYAVFVPLGSVVALALLRRRGGVAAALWLGLVLAVALVDRYGLFSQAERIHYPQYAVMALGLRYLTGRDLAALLGAGVLGAVDEAYQALVLYGDRPELPLDFKDMLLNVMGAAMGLMVAAALGGSRSRGSDPR